MLLWIRALRVVFCLFFPKPPVLSAGQMPPWRKPDARAVGDAWAAQVELQELRRGSIAQPDPPLEMSLMSRSMHTVQHRKSSRLQEGFAQTGSVAKYLRASPLWTWQLLCSLFCLLCYWRHAVSRMLCPEGSNVSLEKGGSGMSQFSPDSKSIVQISQFGSITFLHHEFLFQKNSILNSAISPNLEKNLKH